MVSWVCLECGEAHTGLQGAREECQRCGWERSARSRPVVERAAPSFLTETVPGTADPSFTLMDSSVTVTGNTTNSASWTTEV